MLQSESVSESEIRSVVSNSLRPHELYSPWSSPDQNTGVGSLPLLQQIFLAQESNWGLLHCRQVLYQLSYLGSPVVKNPPTNVRNEGSIPGLGRSPGEGNGNLLQYFCLENPTDRGAWQATVHGVTKELDLTYLLKQLQSCMPVSVTSVVPAAASLLQVSRVLLVTTNCGNPEHSTQNQDNN